jgi:cell division protein FtsL
VPAQSFTTSTVARSRPFLPRVHPLALLAGAPIAVATILISLSVVLYVLQANQANVLELRLNSSQAETLQLTDINSQLQVQADRLSGIQRIERIATSQLHMIKPALSATIWLGVTVPSDHPRPPQPVQVRTGPLAWMESMIHTVSSGL